MNSQSVLHAFLFHLRTPLASIRGIATSIEKGKIPSDKFPSEAHDWLNKWVPKINVWSKRVGELTALYSQLENEDYDWNALIQQLMSALEDVEIAAMEANNLPRSDKDEPSDVSNTILNMMINSIEHIRDSYKEMQALLPTLD